MKKIFAVFLSAAVIVLSLASCSTGTQSSKNSSNGTESEITECNHEWSEATCDLPKTCTKCGITEGGALGHSMINNTCTRCGYSEWSVKDFGFYDLDKCNTFVRIRAYDLGKKEVLNEDFGKKYENDRFRYIIIEFHDNYILRTTLNTEESKKTSREAFTIIDKDTIRLINQNNYYLTIYEKVVINKQENTFIMKILSGSQGSYEEWYVSYDAIDWSNSPEKTTIDGEEGLKFKLK